MTDEAAFTPMAPVDQAVTRDAAPAALELLRADRMNGKVGQEHYLRRAEYLHSVMNAAPDAAAPPPPRGIETPEQQLERVYDENMAAPAPEKYVNLPKATAFEGDAADVFDMGVRNVFHRGGVPQHLAAPILESVIANFDALASSDDETRAQRVDGAMWSLKQRWGTEFDTRLGRVNDLIAEMLEADDSIGDLFDTNPWAFHADARVIEHLDTIAAHKARKAAR